MASLERLTTLAVGLGFTLLLRRAGHALLTEANGLDLSTFTGHDDVTLFRVVGRALGLVETAHARAGKLRVTLGFLHAKR